jgi:hypothetical protein
MVASSMTRPPGWPAAADKPVRGSPAACSLVTCILLGAGWPVASMLASRFLGELAVGQVPAGVLAEIQRSFVAPDCYQEPTKTSLPRAPRT